MERKKQKSGAGSKKSLAWHHAAAMECVGFLFHIRLPLIIQPVDGRLHLPAIHAAIESLEMCVAAEEQWPIIAGDLAIQLEFTKAAIAQPHSEQWASRYPSMHEAVQSEVGGWASLGGVVSRQENPSSFLESHILDGPQSPLWEQFQSLRTLDIQATETALLKEYAAISGAKKPSGRPAVEAVAIRREDVGRLMAEGLTQGEIAAQLGTTIETVKADRKAINSGK